VTPTIDILLATYNGGKYLCQQLDSIINQTCSDWRLIIRDDCSSDDSPAIIELYRTKHPDRIFLLDMGKQNIGVVSNFSLLLEHATADYIMFCDQDDIWLPDKIALTFAAMKKLVAAYGSVTPLMVHSDLVLVSESLETVSASFWKCQNLDPERGKRLNRLLLQNIATGCTMMINRRLQNIASPIPSGAIVHDWWLTLAASAFGRIGTVPEPTILYRQHADNVIGAKPWRFLDDLLMLATSEKRAETRAKSQKLLSTYRIQAQAFLDRYGAKIPSPLRKMVHVFANLDGFHPVRRKYFIIKYHFFYNNPIITAAMILFRW
jgi:glycosyltransferase involved in cell wall biosynthesis